MKRFVFLAAVVAVGAAAAVMYGNSPADARFRARVYVNGSYVAVFFRYNGIAAICGEIYLAAAVMYGNSPAEPVMVTVAEAEDGSIELVESTKSDNSDKNATDSDDSVNGEKNAVSEVGFSMPAAF